jgi:hypothetical protein
MILQCYFKREQESRLFRSGLYLGFGLEPDVNPAFEGCPELADQNVRTALVEYGAMLNV